MRPAAAAVLVLASLPASASQFTQRRDPPPEGRRLEARDGDVVIVENDDRVRLVRRRHATARVVVDEARNLVVVLADFAPAGGQPDGMVDQAWRYTLADTRWPLDARWDGPVTIEEDEMAPGRPGSSLRIETASGVVIFDNNPQPRANAAGAIAVLRFQSYAGGGSRPLPFDESERQQLSDNPPPGSYSSFATGPGAGGVRGGVWGGMSMGGVPAGAPGGVATGGGPPYRVGGGIALPRKIHDVKPIYPPEASQARVQGIVILEITVAQDGTVQNPRVLRSIPLLDQAALDAVSQWRFEPPLVNGQPVPVIMTVTVSFTTDRPQ